MSDQHNVRATARENTGRNTYKGHTASTRIEIKISDPVGNRTWAARLEGRERHYQPCYCDVQKPYEL